jgi:hypothetical protein
VRSGSLAQPIRIYRHPDTGEEAHLYAGPIADPTGTWWVVHLMFADGRPGAVAGQPMRDSWRDAAAAREAYRERVRALQAHGWVRVD